MHTYDRMKAAWELYAKDKEGWEKKNAYYHTYISRLVSFLVPQGVRVFHVRNPIDSFEGAEGVYDYIVISDKLGYLYDIQVFFDKAASYLKSDGRIVVIQYCALWEPILKVAAWLRLRAPWSLQNWISMHDIETFFSLSGFEPVKTGKKVLFPITVPFITPFMNGVVANVWPFSHLGLIHYAVGRRAVERDKNASLSIVVPVRNEAGTIKRIVSELPQCGAFTEVIFVEGHSTDDTLSEIQRVVSSYAGPLRLSFTTQDGRGKGDAVRKGFSLAKGDVLAIYDGDMTVPPEDVCKFYDVLVSGRGDFINGSRLVYPLEKQSMRLLNYFGNKFFSTAFSMILGQTLKDTLCGTKVLFRKDYEIIARNRAFFGNFDPFGDFDLLFGAAKLNLKIVDLPIRYQERTYGTTNISRFKHGLMLLRMTVFAARKMVFW